MSMFSTEQTFSFLCVALGLAFVPLGNRGLRIDAIKFRFNIYTGPGYLSALLGIINIILLIVIFRESKLTKLKESEKMKKPESCKSFSNSLPPQQKMKRLLAGECIQRMICNKLYLFSTWFKKAGHQKNKLAGDYY